MNYHGRTLNLAPVNITLGHIAGRLEAGLPTLAELQPGDGTRYEFLMVPLTGQLEHAGGYNPGAVAHVACNLRTDGKFMAITLGWGDPGPYDFEGYENEHTREVMASFYCLLRAAMHERVMSGHHERTAALAPLASDEAEPALERDRRTSEVARQPTEEELWELA